MIAEEREAAARAPEQLDKLASFMTSLEAAIAQRAVDAAIVLEDLGIGTDLLVGNYRRTQLTTDEPHSRWLLRKLGKKHPVNHGHVDVDGVQSAWDLGDYTIEILDGGMMFNVSLGDSFIRGKMALTEDGEVVKYAIPKDAVMHGERTVCEYLGGYDPSDIMKISGYPGDSKLYGRFLGGYSMAIDPTISDPLDLPELRSWEDRLVSIARTPETS